MATNTPAQREGHWRDRAITAAEAISDAFDVVKAYGAHVANWVLFFCLIATLIEMVSPDFEAMAGLAIVGIQSISLDVAGFGLTAMAASAKRRGDKKSAMKANGMGWTLIGVMAITVGLITLAAFKPEWASNIQQANQILMFVRVIVTVFYGHIVHELRTEGAAHENRLAELETAVSTLQQQIKDKEQEVTNAQGQLTNQQKTFSSLQQQLEDEKNKAASIQHKLDFAQQRAGSLEQEMESDQSGVIGQRRELNSAKLHIADLQSQLETNQQILKNEQMVVSNLRREVERLQQARATFSGSEPPARATHQSQSSEPVARRSVDSRATSQSHQGPPNFRIIPGSKVASEPVEGKPTGTPEERLQSAYELLSTNGARVSGRALAREAHVNRGTANEWLERVKGQKSEPEDESTGEHEAIAQGQ